MKNHLKDGLEVLLALLITGSMASAMAPKLGSTKPYKAIVATKPGIVAPAPQTPAVAPPVPVQPQYTDQHQEWMAEAGIAPSDFDAVDYIISHESGWCPTVWEGEAGCPAFHGASDYDGYGLCQSTPPQKMAAAGADWQTNPVTQLKWCSMHAAEYGGWWAAYNHWTISHNW